MQKSYGWEAIYTTKPDFSSDLDYCLFDNKRLIGIAAGHKIENPSAPVYSLEILAIDTTYQKKGITPLLIKTIFNSIPDTSLIQFWTKDHNIKTYYEKALKLPCIQSLKHKRHRESQQEFWLTEESKIELASIWCFACTQTQVNLFNHSTQFQIETN